MVTGVSTGSGDRTDLEVGHRLVVVVLEHLKLLSRHSGRRQLVTTPGKYAVRKSAVIRSSLFVEIDRGAANKEFKGKFATASHSIDPTLAIGKFKNSLNTSKVIRTCNW